MLSFSEKISKNIGEISKYHKTFSLFCETIDSLRGSVTESNMAYATDILWCIFGCVILINIYKLNVLPSINVLA